MRVRIVVRALCLLVGLYACAAPAGSRAPDGTTVFSAARVADFAKTVERALAERGVRVALISRVGRPSRDLPKAVQFTHVAFAVYSRVSTADGRTLPGYAIYNLYQNSKQPNRSHLAIDFPVDFFAAAHDLEAGVIIPTAALQRRLLEIIVSERYRKFHNPRFSTIANPFNRTYQNCTEYVLDVLHGAIYETDDLEQIKTNLREYFEPQVIELEPLRLLLGLLFSPDISTSDHEHEIRTATFKTIARYMRHYAMATEVFIVR